MKKHILSTLSFMTLSCTAIADNLEHLNASIKTCFEQTKVVENASKRACRNVIFSDIATRENRAIAFHNRGIISLQKGDTDAALSDFKHAVRLQSNMQASLLAIRFMQNQQYVKRAEGAYSE